jgi:hypothetical protein
MDDHRFTVATEKLDQISEAWKRTTWRDLAAALLLAAGRAMTAPELAEALRRDASNVKRDADALVEIGALERHSAPDRAPRTRGKLPSASYTLKAADSLREALAAELSPGELRLHQQLVYVDITVDPLGLSALLADAVALARASWYGMCDGDQQEYMIAFDGRHAARDAVDLMTILDGARIPARRTVVGDVGTVHSLVGQAQHRARLARKARLAADTRRAS